MISNRDIQYMLNHLSGFSDSLHSKTIFITGGTGFIGKWLVECMLHLNQSNKLNLQLILLTRNEGSAKKHYDSVFPNNKLLYIEGDVRNFHYPTTKVDFIIHGATDASAIMNNERPTEMMDIIYNGTAHTLNLAKRDKSKTLFLSSGAIYGVQPDQIESFDENYIGGPKLDTHLSAYGETKRAAEVLCRAYIHQFNLDITIARCFAFVGPYLPLDTHFAIGNFMMNVLKNETITVKSDGKPLRTYMYAADLAIWLMHLLCSGKSGQAYNVGGQEVISIKDLAYLVQSVAGKGQVEILNQNPAIYVNLNYVCNVQKFMREFNINSMIPLREGIERTIEFHQ